MNLSRFSPQSSIPNWKVALLALLMVVGFADASFLAVEHYRGVIPPCGVLAGCETVTTSSYATVGPVPIALFGALYYAVMLALTIGYWDLRKKELMGLVCLISSLGFLSSLGLVYLQLFVLHAICVYCMASAITSTLIFGIVGSAVMKKPQVSP